MADMCAILPHTGGVYSSIHLESGLALVTCMTNRMYQKWHSGTFKTRSWEVLQLPSSLFEHSFLECSPMEHAIWGPSCHVWKAQARWKGPAELPANSQHQLPAMWVSEGIILDIPVPADIIWRKTQTPGIRTQSSHHQPLEPPYLRPQMWSRYKPSLLYLVWIPDPQNYEHNKIVVVLCQ